MQLAAISYALPRKRLSNAQALDELVARVRGLDDDEIEALRLRVDYGYRLTGSQYRFWTEDDEPVMDHAMAACRSALEKSGLEPDDIEAIIYVGVARGTLEPSAAAAIQKHLGASRATGFDILEACVSWVRGLEIAQSLMKAGRYRNVLLVNCEMGMRSFGMLEDLQPSNLDLYFSGLTIGEAATATVLLPEGPDFEFHFRTYPEGYGYCMIPLENAARFVPDELPDHALPNRFFAISVPLVQTAVEGLRMLYAESGYGNGPPPELTLTHSVSERASHMALNALGLDWANHFDIHASHGNTVSASLPLGIALAIEAGRLTADTDLLLIGAGAGVSTGLCRLKVAAAPRT